VLLFCSSVRSERNGIFRLLLLVSLGFYEIESVSRQLSEEEERRFHQFEEEEENED
jgi:hypothetical protein